VKVTIYASTNKERENNIAQALSAGFKRHGDVCETLPTQDYSMPKGDTQSLVGEGRSGQEVGGRQSVGR
jgi:hypothetical protein